MFSGSSIAMTSAPVTVRRQPGNRPQQDRRRSRLQRPVSPRSSPNGRATLAIAQVIEGSLPAGLVGAEDHLYLPDEMLETQIERAEDRCRVGPGCVHFLPPPRHRCGNHIDGRLPCESAVQSGAGVCERVADTLLTS